MIRNKDETLLKKDSTHEQGDDAMTNSMIGYAALDLQSLSKKNVRIVSSSEALKDVSPIKWEEETLQGSKKITITKEKR